MSTSTATLTEPQERVQSEQSKFVQHLATYPALSALAGLIASFPVAKIFVSNAVPLLHAIHERSRPIADPVSEKAAPYLRTLDDAGDAALSKLDERFPQLHTVQPSEVYEGAQHYVDSVKDNAYALYDAKVTQPISSVKSAAINQIEATNNTVLPKVYGVYNEKLLEQTKDTSAEPGYIAKSSAALATGRYLSIESYRIASNHFGTPEKSEEAVDQVKEKVAAAEKAAQEVLSEGVEQANQKVPSE